MASLDAQRADTENARGVAERRDGLSAAQDAKKRKVDQRKALIEAKRAKLLGGEKEVDRLRAEKRAAETDRFLQGLEEEMRDIKEEPA